MLRIKKVAGGVGLLGELFLLNVSVAVRRGAAAPAATGDHAFSVKTWLFRVRVDWVGEARKKCTGAMTCTSCLRGVHSPMRT
jgi:hypothetical protein